MGIPYGEEPSTVGRSSTCHDGEVGFVAQGIDWRKIPINFTWSLNLNTQLDARERHGVLFFIEQGLMPRTGKRYEWEVGAG